MTVIEWDKVGERRFETGVDRGVLYLPDGTVVPWNGLTEVTENRTRDAKSFYMDGVKYLDHFAPGNFSAKIKAYTYPDELDDLMGNLEFSPGVFLHDQKVKVFNLSYRTLVGNEIEGIDHGYKIHLMYNLVANPGSAGYQTLGDTVTPQVFEWDVQGTPPSMIGVRPTAHISLDSRRIDPTLLDTLEDLLYGSDLADPALPDFVTLVGMIEAAA